MMQKRRKLVSFGWEWELRPLWKTIFTRSTSYKIGLLCDTEISPLCISQKEGFENLEECLCSAFIHNIQGIETTGAHVDNEDIEGVGEMAQQKRTFVSLAEDLSSSSRTHVMLYNRL